MTDHIVLFPAELWEMLDNNGWTWGWLGLRVDDAEGVVTIAQVSKAREISLPVDTTQWQSSHYLHHADIVPLSGVWYRVRPDLHVIHDESARRGAVIPTDTFKDYVEGGWVEPGVDGLPVIAVSTQQAGFAGASAWRVFPEQAHPTAISTVNDAIRPSDFLSNVWPIGHLDKCKVTLIGVGSIGSMIADTLTGAGVGELTLIDDDRLEQRNLARHRLTGRDLGRLKVHAMKDLLLERGNATRIDSHPINILTETDLLRPIVGRSDIVVCAADGVAPRRVANHVSRWAGKPLVLAAVLEDGAFGEVVRIRNRTGCLYCLRLTQIENGSFDPEPGIDLGYGTGTTHRPMTAAPSDLQLVATLAAKVALSTLLEANGRWNQRLPGDFAIIGLQPKPDMPEPFDIERAGDLRWHELPDRRNDCPTCMPE